MRNTSDRVSLVLFLSFFSISLSSTADLKAETQEKAVGANSVVEMRSISFSPESLTIKEGQSVQWSNVSYTDHSATGQTFDTDMVKPKNSSKPVVFLHAGKFVYHCKMHGRTMSGLIIVTPAK